MPTKNWPHPVLDAQTEDYPNCAFQTRFQVRQTKLDYKVVVNFDLGCESLENAVKAGDAQFLVQVHCVKTAYREIFPASVEELEFAIPEHELRDTFALSPFIVARREFDLASDEFAATFKGLKFKMRPGAVLAVGLPAEYEADKVFDELKNISAIFEVIKQPDRQAEAVEYDLTRNKIAIALPHAVYDEYRIFRPRPPYRESFVCSLVLPGLAAALEALGPEDSDGGDSLRWRRALRRKLKEINKSEVIKDESYKLAQELLEWPFGRALQAIRIAESEES